MTWKGQVRWVNVFAGWYNVSIVLGILYFLLITPMDFGTLDKSAKWTSPFPQVASTGVIGRSPQEMRNETSEE
jgi:hypothetical protein